MVPGEAAAADAATPPCGDERPLFYLVDWLPPDFGAVGQYAEIFATEQAMAGREVCLIGLTTGRGSRSTRTFDSGGRLTVLRLTSRRRPADTYLSRAAWLTASNIMILWALFRRLGRRPAEVLFTGSPPFMLYFIMALKALRRVELTYRITDFYPEVVIAAARSPSPPLRRLEALTWRLRRRIDRFQVLGEDQRRILLAGGVRDERIILVRDRSPVAFVEGQAPLPRPASLGGRLVLLYSGNFGVAHDVDTALAGLTEHHRRGSDRFALWINGSGANADRLAESLSAAEVPVARTPAAPLEHLARLLVTADVHLITLRPAFSGYVLPSKVYGCVGSGKPVLFVGPESSDVHLICSQAPGLTYRRVETGDATGFAEALEAFADEHANRANA